MNHEDLEDIAQEDKIKRKMAIDELSQFLDLGLNNRIDLESQIMRGISIKLTEYEHELIDVVAKTIGKSKSKVLQELIGSYMDAAYASYLKGLYQQGDLSTDNMNFEGLIEHLKKDASELQKIGVNGFDVFMLLRMGYTNEGLDLYSQKSFSTKLGHSNE